MWGLKKGQVNNNILAEKNNTGNNRGDRSSLLHCFKQHLNSRVVHYFPWFEFPTHRVRFSYFSVYTCQPKEPVFHSKSKITVIF